MIDAKGTDVHEALEEVKAQKEKLEEEVRIKTDLCNNLKRAQDELLTKVQEAKLQSKKQAQELSAKSEELSTLSQLHQDLKSSFQEKESAFKHLNSAIEKLRYEYGEKLQKFEGENKELILALEEAKTTSEFLESKVDSSNMEIEDLKRVLLLKDKKLVEISDKSQTTKDLIQRDEVISKLEEKHRDVQDQLKWKNEQFQHLEEAHKKLQDHFKSSKTEWENEKSLLLHEICSLQTNLDSQTRISENLQTQLRICNQALAHEESNKKLLEVEISEYKSRFDDIYSECHEAKMTIEKLSHKRDEEVAELRDCLAEKDSVSKEMEYKLERLEQENKDLIASLKEFQDSQISNCGNTGLLKKLQKKYNSLEQVHKKCSEKLKEEVELKSELEKITKERDDYSTKLNDQSEQVMQLKRELKSCNFLPEVQNEEMSSVVLVLKTQFSETYTKMEQKNKENEDMILHLKEELEVKNNAICEISLNLSKRCEEVASLMKKVELFDDMKQHQLVMEELLAESSRKQVLLEEQIRVLESSQNHDDKNHSDVLSQKLVKLEKEKRFVESQNMQLETENQSLLHQVNEQNEKIVDLQQQLVLLETLIAERTEAQRKEKEKNLEIIEEKESSINNLLKVIGEKKQRIEGLVKEMTNALMISEEKQKLEDEFSGLCEKVKVKDESLLKSTQRAEELEDLLRTNKVETKNLLDEKTRLVDRVNNLEVQNQILYEEKQKLEDGFSGLCETVKVKDESLLKSTQRAEELEDLLRITKSDTQNLMDEKTRLVDRVNYFEAQNQVLYEEKQKLEDGFSGLCEKVKDESLLKSTQRAEELEDLLRMNKLETKNLMDEKTCLVDQLNNLEVQNQVLYEEKQKLEDGFAGLCEKVKVKDESLLKSIQRADELDDLLRISKLETKNLMDEETRLVDRVNNLEAQNQVLYEEKQKLEDRFSDLCEKVKVKDESLLKSTQRADELDDLLRISKLETKNLMDEKTCLVDRVNNLEAQNQVLYEEKQKLEDGFAGLCDKVKFKDESLLKSTHRADELDDLLRISKLETKNLMDEKTRLVDRVNNLEAQNQVLYEEKQKLEDGFAGLCDKVKVKDESLLKSTQQAEELEDLLRNNKLETKNLMDEKTRLENQVNNLEVQNKALCEDIEKILLQKDDLLVQMKTTSKQMEEYFNDVELEGMLENMLQKC
ncbi:hypothetical protein L1987_49169 [Smallanthus sonchifolius]|uniref:Uncharacterized protein n=1 Tax=Smallanthus sonchifolius TaxID=185202 RepID=A0ACB9FUU8_9ASTR|nr:hypothetical protein L1987_49169 [Smallanthus sonchifolius]